MPVSGVRCGVLILALLIVAPWALMETPSAQEPAPAEAGPPADAIREAQVLLEALGYAPGPAEASTWDDSLSRAYRAFLRDAGLPASETLTPRGLRSLREVARAEGVAAGTGAPVDTAPASASDSLHRAVVAGDIDGAQALLSDGAAVDGRDGQGWTALMHAANKGYVLLVEMLLRAGASPDIRAPDGATALFIAVMNGHPEAIALLMRAGALVSIRGPRGLTPADAARLIYGDNEGQRPVPDDAEVHALLRGMSWEEAVKAAIAGRRVEQVPDPPATPGPGTVEASLGFNPTDRRLIQSGLTALGYRPGPVDGVFGPATRQAIRAWQKTKGLSETGYLTREQADALVAAADKERAEQARIAREQAAREDREKAEREEAERELWASVKESGDPSDLETYLDAYPDGEYDALARQRLNTLIAHQDDADYARARSVGTVTSYEGYLSAYPSGRHVAEARTLLAEASKPKWEIGRQFRDCDACPEMVVVPAGSFTMGSPPSEEGRWDNEGPQHRVTISEPFAVGKYEVTFAEWDACVAASGCNRYRPDDEGWGRDQRPVINVSWKDAKAYVGWLSRRTGERYRLLSEAEWEYAARAGTTGPFHFGLTISTDQANYEGNYSYGSGRTGVYREKTVPVGSFRANRFALHDTHGNVWEWVEDCWHGSYADAPTNQSAWSAGGDCDQRVVRGGSWINGPSGLRSAIRSLDSSGNRESFFGFRVARTLTP